MKSRREFPEPITRIEPMNRNDDRDFVSLSSPKGGEGRGEEVSGLKGKLIGCWMFDVGCSMFSGFMVRWYLGNTERSLGLALPSVIHCCHGTMNGASFAEIGARNLFRVFLSIQSFRHRPCPNKGLKARHIKARAEGPGTSRRLSVSPVRVPQNPPILPIPFRPLRSLYRFDTHAITKSEKEGKKGSMKETRNQPQIRTDAPRPRAPHDYRRIPFHKSAHSAAFWRHQRCRGYQPRVARVCEGYPGFGLHSTHHFRAQRGACPAIASERRRKRSEYLPVFGSMLACVKDSTNTLERRVPLGLPHPSDFGANTINCGVTVRDFLPTYSTLFGGLHPSPWSLRKIKYYQTNPFSFSPTPYPSTT